MIQRTHSRRHGGFTLIELLVVIAILAILASLTAVAVMGFLGNQSGKNTKLVLQKVDNALQQQWSEVRQQAWNEAPPTSATALAGTDLDAPNRAKVIWVKLRFKKEFPMSFAEALNPGAGLLNPSDLTPIPEYVTKVRAALASPNHNPQTEMAACLLMALRRPRSGKKFNEEALGANAIKDTDGDGLEEIVDGWGNPIGFCRWGTGNSGLTSLFTGPTRSGLDNDTQDQDKRLMNATWNASASATSFQGICHIVRANNGAGPGPFSYYTKPVIVSAGKDGIMGLNLPPSNTYPWDMSITGAGATDNIYSFQVN